jgi:hypothetical protein
MFAVRLEESGIDLGLRRSLPGYLQRKYAEAPESIQVALKPTFLWHRRLPRLILFLTLLGFGWFIGEAVLGSK